MTTKERVVAELSKFNDDEMSQLLKIVEQMAQKEAEPVSPGKPGLLSKLKQIKIDAPEDFAANLDAYMSGEKQIGDSSDVH
jgi:hypothetical protein